MKQKHRAASSARKQHRALRQGDRVRIKNYKKLAWGRRKPQEFGFITRIDGSCIYVRPRWRPASEQFELYDVEIELANHG